jgi:hypothetical protein
MPSHNFLVFIILSLIWVRIDGAPAAFNVLVKFLAYKNLRLSLHNSTTLTREAEIFCYNPNSFYLVTSLTLSFFLQP